MTLRKLVQDALPFRIMLRNRLQYDEDGLASRNSAPFLNDSLFQQAYAAGASTGSWGMSSIRWRVHVVLWATSIAKHLPGDFAECGVNRGGLAQAIVERHDWNSLGKKFFLLDTFGGFDDRFKPQNLNHWEYEDSYSEVVARFTPYNGVRAIKGAVPDTLTEIDSDQFAFVSIDMNVMEPERAALEFFWPRMVKGGVIVFDDFTQPGHELQQRSHFDFAARNGFEILALPTGQGMAIKV